MDARQECRQGLECLYLMPRTWHPWKLIYTHPCMAMDIPTTRLICGVGGWEVKCTAGEESLDRVFISSMR